MVDFSKPVSNEIIVGTIIFLIFLTLIGIIFVRKGRDDYIKRGTKVK